ncbi:MAG TPA: DNA translocase FtsK 4TM domain-containing protein [Candidatus Polarisedimenticolia bacterium]|nr:DNA translocase FtsK 4TM domain-containing protein [Candidatus Polarisedimenticolia bacterium]
MAKTRKLKKKESRRKPRIDWVAVFASRLFTEAWGIILLVGSALLLLSLLSHTPSDGTFFGPGHDQRPTRNLVGSFGANLSEGALQFLGFCAYLLPLLLGWSGWKKFWNRPGDHRPFRVAGTFLVVLSSASLFALLLGERRIGGSPYNAGGWLGDLLSTYLKLNLGTAGTALFCLMFIGVGILMATRMSLAGLIARVKKLTHETSSRFLVAYVRQREAKRREALRTAMIQKHARMNKEEPARKTAPAAEVKSGDGSPEPRPASAPPALETKKTEPKPETRKPSAQPSFPFVGDLAGYVPPPLSLLTEAKEEQGVDDKELMETAKLIASKFREFQVEGQVVQIHPGPVVTTFEFKPDAGVKYSKITSLSDDLCLAIQAESARIDRISGKSTVGIEVPNKHREVIALRELLGSEKYTGSGGKLTLALGKKIHGEPFITDLAKMPHLLIAGATGAGKSVGLNAMITSILYKAGPEEVKFIFIDTKRLELGIYDQIPHLLTPVVTEPKQASNALKWATLEMERRYRSLAECGVRNIDQFNSLLGMARKEGKPLTHSVANADGTSRTEEVKPLPFIVVVIDELADLMMTAAADVEESITRLAQMARAVGIHLILSTQRPSVDIITGVIKANFPSRIAFRVSSKVDSRTILDSNGAEQLLGNGDMLFLPPGSSRLIRLHSPLLTEMESNRVIAYLRKQGKPEFNPAVTKGAESKKDGLDDEVDEMYEQASRLVVQTGQASISHLQRRLKLGYARAARIVDMMERDGIVGPGEGAKPREILVKADYFEELDRHRAAVDPDA